MQYQKRRTVNCAVGVRGRSSDVGKLFVLVRRKQIASFRVDTRNQRSGRHFVRPASIHVQQ